MRPIAVVQAFKENTLGLLAEYPATIVHCADSYEAIEAVEHGDAVAIMKGDLSSGDFLRPIVREYRSRPNAVLSHVYRLVTPRGRVVYVTDAAVNIAPDLDAKREILMNAVDAWLRIERDAPRVAVLSATEEVNPAMPASEDAAQLVWEFNSDECAVQGPLAFDNAWDLQAAEKKGVDGPVAGRADILLVPDIMSGNMLAKSMVYVGRCAATGFVMGAKCPVILLSRADDKPSKLSSMLLATRMA